MSEEKSAKYYTGRGYLKVGLNRYKPLYNEIIKLLPKPYDCPTIIDLGCGVGYFASLVYKKGYKNYIGIDFSEDMIKHSKKRVPNYEYILINLSDEKLKEIIKNYKLFIMLETLEHINNDLDVLNKIPSNAVIIGSVPNINAKGHVRTFGGIHDVFNRYESIIEFDFLKELKMNPKQDSKITIFRGVIKDD